MVITKEVVFMKRQLRLLALPALALACLLCVTEASYAQRGGRGGGGRGGYSGYRGGYGGYRGGYYGGGYYGPSIGIGIGLGSPYYGGYYGRGYGGYSPYYYGSGYYVPYSSNGYVYSDPGYTDGVSSASYQSLYPPGAAVQQGQSTAANIHVRVPPNAQVMFDDTPTTQTGADRMFTTGPLDPSRQYSYQITARWNENGQERRETRTARVIPGRTVDVDFMSPPPPQQLQQPRNSTEIR
jgi:uncharacterized protein (TIGR03000 family)